VAKSFTYYPGCALHSSAKEYDVSVRLVCQALGIELKEIDWICCGASSAHTISPLLSIALPAFGLKQAEGRGLPLLAPCALCFSRLKFAAQELARERTKVENALGEKFGKIPPVHHLLQVLAQEDIPVKKPLSGLRVACYYGCLLVRPSGVVQFDDVENPTMMDNLVSSLGAEAIPWAFKTECCGAGMSLPLPDMVQQLCYRILSQAKEEGSEVIVVACPMCHSNLDLYQRGRDSMPILYLSQLVGLALGFSPRQLLMDKHFVSPLPLLRGKGWV